jgi:PEGA domain.
MVYAGVTPLTLSDIDAGNHLIQVSPEGFFSQTQNISVKSGEKSTISFSFVYSDRLQIPAMVRIGECVGTPEPSDLDGTSFDLLTLDDGTMMAYYSGWEEGILCMESSDGIHWDKKTARMSLCSVNPAQYSGLSHGCFLSLMGVTVWFIGKRLGINIHSILRHHQME